MIIRFIYVTVSLNSAPEDDIVPETRNILTVGVGSIFFFFVFL